MRLYLAAPFAGRDIVAEDLPTWEVAGHEITSGWVKSTRALTPESFGISASSTDEEVTAHAEMDLKDIDAAEVLVHYTADYFVKRGLDPVAHNLTSGGRHVETGYALATLKPVIIIGQPENIFQRGLCFWADNVNEALLCIKEFL